MEELIKLNRENVFYKYDNHKFKIVSENTRVRCNYSQKVVEELSLCVNCNMNLDYYYRNPTTKCKEVN